MPSTASYEQERAGSLRGRKGKADGIRFRASGYVAATKKPKTAQAVVKVISQARGHRAKILMNYVARTDTEEALSLEDERGVQLAGADDIESVYNKWKQDFERAKPGQKNPPRHVTHLIFSGDCKQTPENARAVQSAIAEVMQEQFGQDGYRYLMALHTDTGRPHVHVLLNAYNRDKERPKIRLNPPELLAMRQQFAQKLRERGIEQHATLRKDRVSVLEAVAKGAEELQAGGAWFERQLFKAAEANTVETPAAFNAFAKRRQMVRAVARLKADVKAHTLPFSQERRERMALLRRIDHELIDPAAPDYKRLVESLVLKVEKDRERVKDYIRALSDPDAVVTDNKRRRQRETSIGQIVARNLEAVRSARLDLMRSPGVGVVEGYQLGHQLKAYERELRRLQTRFAFGAERAAVPGTSAEVAKERAAVAALVRAARTADRLERLGPWYEPNPGARSRSFDPFAKRRALVSIATHLSGALEAAEATPGHPLADRVASLRRSLIDAPAPDPQRVMRAVENRLQETRLRVDLDARRAAHPATPAVDRDALRFSVRQRLTATTHALRAARREVAELPGLSERERETYAARLKRAQQTISRAGQLVENPNQLAATLHGIERATPSLQRETHGIDLYAGPAGYGLRDSPTTPFKQPELYAFPYREGAPAATLDSLRTLSGLDLDGATKRPAVLLPDHARDRVEDQGTARPAELRRSDAGLSSGSGREGEGRSEGERLAPRAAPGDRLTADQLGDLLQHVYTRLQEAKAWDDPAPFRSGLREFYEGARPAPVAELDAFAKRAAMLKEIESIRPEVDAAHVSFTPEMRRTLAAIRGLRDELGTPARDIERLINQLAEKVAKDQIAIEARKDKPAASAVEALQRRRAADRVMNGNQVSIQHAQREIANHPKLKPMERIALSAKVRNLGRAVDAYLGRAREKS